MLTIKNRWRTQGENMEKDSSFIAKLAKDVNSDQTPTFEEWLALMASAKHADFVTSLLSSCLSPRCHAWRPRAINFLLDTINSGEFSVSSSKNAIEPLDIWKCKAADLLCEYLRDDPEKDSHCRWARDFHESPEMYVYLLRTLRMHEDDPYMMQPNHPESGIKRFLKRCTTALRWGGKDGFVTIRDQHLTELFLTLIRYELSDLIYRTDEAALESLKAIVFGPPDEYGFRYDKSIPETVEAALLLNNPRRRAAERLVLLKARHEANDKKEEAERIASEMKSLERQRERLLHGT